LAGDGGGIVALLHDLAEVRLTDLPATAARLIPDGVKRDAEATALTDLLAPLPGRADLLALWQDFENLSSPEARLARDADKLEMMVQCLHYEQAGSHNLDEFWKAMDEATWHYALSAELYGRLKQRRERGSSTAYGGDDAMRDGARA